MGPEPVWWMTKAKYAYQFSTQSAESFAKVQALSPYVADSVIPDPVAACQKMSASTALVSTHVI